MNDRENEKLFGTSGKLTKEVFIPFFLIVASQVSVFKASLERPGGQLEGQKISKEREETPKEP